MARDKVLVTITLAEHIVRGAKLKRRLKT